VDPQVAVLSKSGRRTLRKYARSSDLQGETEIVAKGRRTDRIVCSTFRPPAPSKLEFLGVDASPFWLGKLAGRSAIQPFTVEDTIHRFV
jgi:hypothetical protein